MMKKKESILGELKMGTEGCQWTTGGGKLRREVMM